MFQHEGYIIGERIANDVSLVRLSQPANLNSPYIEMISMANSGEDFTGKSGWIIGWGIDEVGGRDRAVILQQAQITVHPRDYCESIYGDLVDEGQICLGEPGLRGSCTSDSGGPLIVDGILAGITSWGGGSSCNPDFPSVYESVAYHREWIRANIDA